jgi:hypothetical protein
MPYRLDNRHCDGAAKNSDAKQITASKESAIPLAGPRSRLQRAHDNRTAAKLLSCLKSGSMLPADRGYHATRSGTLRVKLAANDLAFVELASIRLWLRVNKSTI